jgi:beta-lactamase superfamily II metal-dependent hydrolase
MTRLAALALVVLTYAAPASAGHLDIVFIDVEGGQATLIVTPAGESLLVDAGYGGPRGSRDTDRIMAAIRRAGLARLDYLLVTHFHPDHVGGVPDLASRIPIGTFIDYGSPMGTPYGTDRMTTRSFLAYEPVRSQGRHIRPEPGDRLPLEGLDIDIVSVGGALISTPLPGGGAPIGGCASLEHHPEDGTENFRSIGFRLQFGAFSFVDLGDLSGNTLPGLVCPFNLIGQASVYLVAHHGDYDSNAPAMYEALRPRVAIMNNGPTKGGDPEALKTAHAQPDLDLWQLHASRHAGARNSPEEFIANLDDGATAHWIHLRASEDGSFDVTNSRNGASRRYPPAARPHQIRTW